MPVVVAIPGPLQPYAGGRATVEVPDSCATVGDALLAVGEEYPGVRDRVLTEQGDVRQHLNVFVDEDNVRFERGLATPVSDGSRVTILPAVSGG
jgi:molybdopterin synthase sulfur carrier subunit